MSGAEVGKLLIKDGFELVRQKGSHIIYKHASGASIPVPNHKSLAQGTLNSIKKMHNNIIFP
jgi:predicted RNA binding protein YcfA (HicA-like mRNA interferase family)